MDNVLNGLLSGYFQHRSELDAIKRETDVNNAMADAYILSAQQLRRARAGGADEQQGTHMANTLGQPVHPTSSKEVTLPVEAKRSQPPLQFGAMPLNEEGASTALLATSRYLQQFVHSLHTNTPLASQNAAGSNTPPPFTKGSGSLANSPQPESANPSPPLGVVLERYRQRKQLLQQKQIADELQQGQGDINQKVVSLVALTSPLPQLSNSSSSAERAQNIPKVKEESAITLAAQGRQVTLPPAPLPNSVKTEKVVLAAERIDLLTDTSAVSVAATAHRETENKAQENVSVSAMFSASSTPPEVREEFEALFGKKPSPPTAASPTEGTKPRNSAGNVVAVVRKSIGVKEKHPKALVGGGLSACAALKRAREEADEDGVHGEEDGEEIKKQGRGRPKSKKPQVECTPAEYWEIQ